MMFGMKPINTKAATPGKAFTEALDAAISAAVDAGLPARAIADVIGAKFKYWDNRAYMAPAAAAFPRVYDQTGKLIDYAKLDAEAQAARKRRADKASEIPPHLRESAASGIKR